MTAPAQLIEGRRVAAMIARAVAAEREECAKAAEEIAEYYVYGEGEAAARDCASRIRARGSAA